MKNHFLHLNRKMIKQNILNFFSKFNFIHKKMSRLKTASWEEKICSVICTGHRVITFSRWIYPVIIASAAAIIVSEYRQRLWERLPEYRQRPAFKCTPFNKIFCLLSDSNPTVFSNSLNCEFLSNFGVDCLLSDTEFRNPDWCLEFNFTIG